MDNNIFSCCSANQMNPSYEQDDPFAASTNSGSKVCPRCRNLVQNPSFEAGLLGWQTNNVTTTNLNPFEGTQQASMGPGVASMLQDILLVCTKHCPLFLSFGAIAEFVEDDQGGTGNLTADVLWLDADKNIIGTGLKLTILNESLNAESRATYIGITERPPAGAVWARLRFSKADGIAIKIDQILLTAINTTNLVQNPSFESGLTYWTSTVFETRFDEFFEGSAQAYTEADGTLSQDIDISDFPANSSYLLAFSCFAGLSSMTVQVIWLDNQDTPIGPPGLELSVPAFTLLDQSRFLTYLDITGPAPANAVKARILFNADIGDQTFIYLDQVIFALVSSPNLVQNHSFENGTENWTLYNTIVAASDRAYEGNNVAQVNANGGVLYQDVPIRSAAGYCYLLNFGIGYVGGGNDASGNINVKVLWLDAEGKEIGVGLNLLLPRFFPREQHWQVYNAMTEPAPAGATKARIQFTKSFSAAVINVDKVVLARLLCNKN